MLVTNPTAHAATMSCRTISGLILVTMCSNLITGTVSHQAHSMRGRQVSTPAAAQPTSMPGAASNLPDGSIQTLNFPPIQRTMASSTQTAAPATYTAGTPSTIRGAPPLPSIVLNAASYPALDVIPPVNSALVRQWMSEIDWSKAPTNSPTGLGGCSNSTNSLAVADSGDDDNCWWTCGGCTRPTDIVSCPDKATWGASFDDGPSPDTPTLLNYLDQHRLKTTFFVVGSRVLSRPAMLQYEYQAGHQISIHSWSHPYLTTLTNEQIVAELGWSKKVIKDVLGVTPNTMRPPYGDIDDRVRFIAMAMGLTPIIWTTDPTGQTFDTQDWKIAAGVVTPAQVLHNFQSILAGASTLPTGFIVLAHDLYPQSVALAVQFVLPSALAAGNLTIEPIITCLGKPLSEGYIETAALTSKNSTKLAGSNNKNVTTSTNPKSAKPSTSITSSTSRSTSRDVFLLTLAVVSALLISV